MTISQMNFSNGELSLLQAYISSSQSGLWQTSNYIKATKVAKKNAQIQTDKLHRKHTHLLIFGNQNCLFAVMSRGYAPVMLYPDTFHKEEQRCFLTRLSCTVQCSHYQQYD